MKITVVGCGYVGLSISVLLSINNKVIAYDIDKKKIDNLNKKVSPIDDNDIQVYLREKKLNLTATTDLNLAFKEAHLIILALPTNFDEKKNSYDTSVIEEVLDKILKVNKYADIVIKSTIPIGYTKKIQKKFNNENIFFSPEFLREGKSLVDNLYPSRIIVGSKSESAKRFVNLLTDAALKDVSEIPIFFVDSTEAEAIKLFANTYLAMRVAFFNELDIFSESNGLNTKNIIQGISSDSRIGDYYNNPGFGYGGYCLPKDTKQLLHDFKDIPNEIISAIVRSNEIRKNYLAEVISNKKQKNIGVFRLTMKTSSDNIRSSAIQDIIHILDSLGHEIIIYEPLIKSKYFMDHRVENDLELFKNKSSLIIANRLEEEIKDVEEKVYTRDIFGNN